MKLDKWGLASALRSAGLDVRETNNWQNRAHGEFPGDPTVMWHHDASPPGDSPGVLDWMISNWNVASANLWINRQGVVFLVGAGPAWHAGRVRNQWFANKNCIGIELDLTVNESQTPAQLAAVRLVTAVILRKSGKKAVNGLAFHKTEALPVGRKVDPYNLDLNEERNYVQILMDQLNGVGGTPQPIPSTPTPTPQPIPTGPTVDQNPDEPFVAWPPAPYKLGQVIEKDDRPNAAIGKLQRRLNNHLRFVGATPMSVDDDFGPTTDKWVRWFQGVRGLKIDGKVGPATWRSLWQ